MATLTLHDNLVPIPRIRLVRYVGVTFYLLLLIPILLAPARPIWDELYHLGTLWQLESMGPTVAFLRVMDVAMGPLYAAFLALLHPIFGDSIIVGARVVSWILLGVLLFVSSRLLLLWKQTSTDRAFLILGIPLLPLMSGFVMTDIPILLLVLLSILTLGWSFECSAKGTPSVTKAILAGGIFSLAILGRQTYLTAFAALPLLVRVPHFRRQSALFFISAVVLPMALFLCWGGLTSPAIQHKEAVAPWTSHPTHFLLCLSQTALLYLFFDPTYLVRRPKVTTGCLMLALIAIPLIEFLVPDLSVRLPVRYVFQNLLGSWEPMFARIALTTSFGIGFLFLAEVIEAMLKAVPYQSFVYGIALTGIATPGLVAHNYSSRYTMASAVLLALLSEARRPMKITWASGARIAAGALLGMVLLGDYLGSTHFTR